MPHTPGPWHYQGATGFNTSLDDFEVNSDGDDWGAVAVVTVNQLGVRNITDEEAEANAKLIAAAPDLLDALVKMTEELAPKLGYGPESNGYIQMARHAIAKATGGS